jgi:IPT/TIG domain
VYEGGFETSVSPPQIAVDSQGEAIAVWQLDRKGVVVGVEVAEKPAGAVWQGPTELSANSYQPTVAIDPAGDAVAVWMHPAVSQPGEYMIQSSYRPAGGSWQAPVSISEEGHDASEPVVAIDPAGEVVALWRAPEGKNMMVQAAVKPPRGAWRAPVDLTEAGRNSQQPSVAIDAEGEAVAVWERKKGSKETVQYAVKPSGGPWGKGIPLSEAGNSLFNAHVAMNAAGETIAVWALYNGADEVLQSSAFQQGAWTPPITVGGPSQTGGEASIAVDVDGHAVAVWQQVTGPTQTTIFSSRYSFARGAPPVIRRLSPRKTPAKGGGVIVLSGAGFEDVVSVNFGSQPATGYEVLLPTEVTAIAPAGTSGPVQISVTTLNGTTAEGRKTQAIYGPPTVSGLNPPSGPLGGGALSITGSGFDPGIANTNFKFGKSLASAVECASTTNCTIQAPSVTKPATVDIIAAVGKTKSKKDPPVDQYRYE